MKNTTHISDIKLVMLNIKYSVALRKECTENANIAKYHCTYNVNITCMTLVSHLDY